MNIKKFFQRKKKSTKCVYRKDVLKYALTHDDHEAGLCRAISRALEAHGVTGVYNHALVDYIPAFTYDNALQFGVRSPEYLNWYWWPSGEWDTGREAFLRWLIKQYKHDTTNLLEIGNDKN